MSASDNLSGPLFHGARTEITGGRVLPPSMTGVDPRNSADYGLTDSGVRHTEAAFATPSESTAWSYARTLSSDPNAPENTSEDPKYRARVYRVAPNKDDEHLYEGQEVANPKGFRITGEESIPPGEQGTFPQINWNKFRPRHVIAGMTRETMKTGAHRNLNFWISQRTHQPEAPEEAPTVHPDQGKLFQ